jgi:glyoxylase-like metal-dependent hydrolase (beta-lactamase superfamily II)
MRRILYGVVLILLASLGIGLAVLGEAHWEMNGLTPVLPDRPALAARTNAEGGPIRVSFVNTATQRGPGPSAVSHPAFVLEWLDGRVFLIDTGMDRERALAFSRPVELLLGAEPIEPHGSPGEQLGPAVQRVSGIAFTHLHSDHTGGLASICEEIEHTVPVFQVPWQADLENYMTSTGRDDILQAGCAIPERLAGGPLYTVPGFPGLVAFAAGGHTPGSTVFVAHVRGTTWVFAGDVTNFKEALLENRPKQRIYSLIIVPEARTHLETLRVWLAALDAEPGVTVVLSHDLDALVASKLPAWSPIR